MISRILFDVLLFLLPFALYAAYLRLRQQDEDEKTMFPDIDQTDWHH